MGFGLKTKLKRIRLAVMISMNDTLGSKINSERSALILCHALEKGMGIPNVKIGYGEEKAKKLLNILENAGGGDRKNLIYISGKSCCSCGIL